MRNFRFHFSLVSPNNNFTVFQPCSIPPNRIEPSTVEYSSYNRIVQFGGLFGDIQLFLCHRNFVFEFNVKNAKMDDNSFPAYIKLDVARLALDLAPVFHSRRARDDGVSQTSHPTLGSNSCCNCSN